MFRSLSRTAVAAVVALTLFAFVPAAQASSFDFSAPSPDTHAGWFDVAFSWLSNLLFGEETSSPALSGSAIEASGTGSFTDINGHYAPMSGICIDPAGSPRCNF